MSATSYKETLDYIYKLLPMYSRIGSAAYKKDLGNTLALLDALGNPHHKLKCVHVAGTNGKGTVSHIIAYGLQMQGMKVGLYTSPHYKDFRERIKINGGYISKKYVSDFIHQHRLLIEKIKPSFFEITVAMAFDYFAKKKVDIAVIEVGLGGRLDSTNVILPLLSVITNISYDHTDMLGKTLPKIAVEKAGIIKNGIPILIGERQNEVQNIFTSTARKTQSPIFFAEDLVSLTSGDTRGGKRKIELNIKNNRYKFQTNLISLYHDSNIVTAFAALNILSSLIPIDFKTITKNFLSLSETVKYIGRWQIISSSPIVIMDSAHNEAGIKLAMAQLMQMKYPKTHIVLGFVKDKSLTEVLKLFPTHATYYFVKANIPRGLDSEVLLEQAKSHGLVGRAYTSVKKGYNAALKNSKKNELIYIGGSIFVTSELL